MRIICIVDFILAEFGKRIASLSRLILCYSSWRRSIHDSSCAFPDLSWAFVFGHVAVEDSLCAFLDRSADLVAPLSPGTVVVSDIVQA
jgi:hypothetical protein